MMNAQDFDQEIEDQCGRMYNLRTRDELLKFQKKLITSVKQAKKGMEQAGGARADLSPHDSRARITKANARYHTAAEEFERRSRHLAYVNAQLAPPSRDALFDGSDAICSTTLATHLSQITLEASRRRSALGELLCLCK